MAEVTVTEYKELKKEAQGFLSGRGSDELSEDPMVISFDEQDFEEDDHNDHAHEVLVVVPEDGITEFQEEFSNEEEEDEHESSEDLMKQLLEELAETDETIDADKGFRLPGAANYVDDEEENKEEEEPEEEVIRDWINDRDPNSFMEYILGSYPDKIPAHDGRSTLGCERAILFLTKLNKEISEALRADNDDVLDLSSLENVRVNMVKDVVKLKEHIKKLNKRLKKSELNTDSLTKDASLVKEATTPRFQLVITPWERAITGIIINSVVSAGKPLEDVYEFLKKKYKFTEREELSIQQLLMDMGQPIFKDRGTIGEKDNDGSGDGIDFIKNYFG
jgi:hypothetical protein